MFERVRVRVQRAALQLSYRWHASRRSSESPITWVVGPYEVAGMVTQLAEAVPGAASAVLKSHPFYPDAYDFGPPRSGRFGEMLGGPILLGRLAARARGVIYLGAEGFLSARQDQREYEFAFLRRHGVRVVCYFTGNDIRSPKRMLELAAERGEPNLGTYLAETNPVFKSDAYDEEKRRVAAVADRHANAIVNAQYDQYSYLVSKTHAFIYLYPEANITDTLDKFDGVEVPRIVHAPSSPVIKGTQLVRAALAALRSEGYRFEYVELQGVSNETVMRELGGAHIALNQFYSSMPGVFGLEAMASGCVHVCSASHEREPQLPEASDAAWVVAAHGELLPRLRDLLDHPERWRDQAQRGQEWVRDYASDRANQGRITRLLDSL